MEWVRGGKSNQDIAQILGVAPATVGKHLERIYPKLGVENRTAAAAVATEKQSRLQEIRSRSTVTVSTRGVPPHQSRRHADLR